MNKNIFLGFYGFINIFINHYTKSILGNFIFSVVSSYLAIYNVFYPQSENIDILLKFSTIYFITDMYFTTFLYKLHHLESLFVIYNIFYNLEESHKIYANYVMLCEISTIFLNIREMKILPTSSFISKMNDILFAITFFITRPLLGTIFGLKLLNNFRSSGNISIILKTISYFLLGLQYFWSFKIIKLIKNRIT